MVADREKHSLLGEYYSDKDLKTLYKTRLDSSIDFRWGQGGPFLWGFKTDLFSIRWTGFLLIDKDGLYDFRLESDDGVRFWIDEQMVINDWNVHSTKVSEGQKELKAGSHSIKVEYFEDYSNAQVRLLWRLPGETEFNIIPSRFFKNEKDSTPND